MKHSFFLYAVHFALVRLINKGAAMLMGGAVPEWYGPFGLFLVMPLLVLLISTVMEKNSAAVYAGTLEAADRRPADAGSVSAAEKISKKGEKKNAGESDRK